MGTETRPYQILLAQDSLADVGIVRIALRDQHLDHVLHVARDGEEAIAPIEEADHDSMAAGPDLLLLDMHLSKYEGEAILTRLRSTEHDRERAQNHAATVYFRKALAPGTIHTAPRDRSRDTYEQKLAVWAKAVAERGDAA